MESGEFENYTDEELKRLREHDLSLINTLRKERKSMMEDIKIITFRKKSVREELIKRGIFKK